MSDRRTEAAKPAKATKPWWAREIRALRKDAGLSVRELAVKTGVSERFLKSIEAGAQTPSISTLEKCLRVYGCELEILER